MQRRNNPKIPPPPVAPDFNRRVEGGLSAMQSLDEYKRGTNQFGSTTLTLNYAGGNVTEATVSDTIRIQPGTSIRQAADAIIEWLSTVADQESDTEQNGHGFAITIECTGSMGTVQKARSTRSRIDSGPTIANANR